MNLLYFIFFFIFISGVTALIEFYFFTRFSGYSIKLYHWVMYIILSYCVVAASHYFKSLILSNFLHICVLFGFIRLFYKSSFSFSILAAMLTSTVTSLSFGLIYSICHILAEFTSPFLLVGILSPIISLVIAFISYQIILKSFVGTNQNSHTFIFILTVPILLILLISQYISDSIYGRTTTINDANKISPFINQWEIIIIQVIAFLSLFSILFAYKKLTNTFQMKTKLALLEQETKSLQLYCEEAQLRYDQTRSFRHDIKSHLIVLDGLIQKGKLNEAHTYLEKLDNTVTLVSFPCQSGNTVIDILLSSKLSLAYQNGIRVSCTIQIPSSFFVNDMDLCIVFSNAVDNAIKASNDISASEKYISISSKQQGNFFMVEFENSHSPNFVYKKGHGLGISNIKAIAEKYKGAVQIEHGTDFYRLNVLFHIPRHFNDISEDIH